jgi:hypothetical protein
LVDAYWKKHSKKDKASRKSLDARPKPGSKIPTKKSLAKDDDSEVGSASVVKKRGRPKAKKDDTDAEDSEAPKKKPRKSNGAEASSKKGAASKKTLEASQDDEDQEMDDDTPIGDMQKYMKVPSWEHLVEAIDTVERTAKGELDVYFRL